MPDNFIEFLTKEATPIDHEVWIQDPANISGDGKHRADEAGRFYADLSASKYYDRLQSLLRTTLDYMEHRLGGYPGIHDPLPIKIVRNHKQGGHITSGQVCINGTSKSGTGDDATYGINISYIFPNNPHYVYSVMGVEMKLPIRAAVPLNWSAIDDNQFERLMYRLYAMNDDFDNVQWLQNTNAPDGGRDISAIRVANGSRVLIQAKHYAASIGPKIISDTVTMAETWNPPFNEVIMLTTGTFTKDAIVWVENHNDRQSGIRPSVQLESGGHVEVMLTNHAYLINGLGLR